jgi:hypothetical protein
MRNKLIDLTFVLACLFIASHIAITETDGQEKEKKTISPAPFEVLEIDLGDRTWGWNLMKVHVLNKLDEKRVIYTNIRGTRHGGNFEMSNQCEVPSHADRWIEVWYFVAPYHLTANVKVKLIAPAEGIDVRAQEPFHVETADFSFPIPNYKCNSINITEKMPELEKYFKGVRHLEPLKPFPRDRIVFYCSPDTPAFNDIEAIALRRESALKELCDFANVTPKEKIAIFFFPDQLTKKMCTGHEGDGLARGNDIYEVYNETVKLDPYHELAHIVMGQVGDPPAMFNEGFAAYIQENHKWAGENVHDMAQNLLTAKKNIPLNKLLARTEIGSKRDDGKIAYPQAASFMGFLIEKFGKEKFLLAYKNLKNGGNNIDSNKVELQKVYDLKLDQLETQWQEYLKTRREKDRT